MYVYKLYVCMYPNLTSKIDTHYSCTHATFSSIDCVLGCKDCLIKYQ